MVKTSLFALLFSFWVASASAVPVENLVENALNPIIPPAPQTCPALPTTGNGVATGEITLQRALLTRKATVWWNPAIAQKQKNGPIVFYWHGTYGSPGWAKFYGLGASFDAIINAGGIIVAPSSNVGPSKYEWHILSNPRDMEDMNLADDIVGCLIKTGNFSPRRIHSAGFSAGAMHTSEFSILRSSYVASVASYSGGLGSTPALPRPIVNRPSAMILHGGPRDTFGGSTEFAPRSVRYFKYTRAIGGAAIICNHGGGHTVPSMSNKPAVFRFFEDNTFDVRSAKYAEGQTLDGSVFPSYCSTTLP